jgi:cytoskeletal protein CcmA (bactofilin family)
MREERGRIGGDVVIYEPFTLWGVVGGDVKVIEGGKFYSRGLIYGNLIVEKGGRVHIFGNVSGDVTLQEKTKVIISGNVGGNVINNGGRLFVEKAAKIEGKIKTHAGETKVEGQYETDAPVKVERHDEWDFRKKLLEQERQARRKRFE